MANLAAANLMHRRTRAAVSVFGVGFQVATVMVLVGLANGTLDAIGQRLESVGADVIFQPPQSSLILGASQAVMPVRLADLIARVPEVTRVTPVLNWHVSELRGSSESLNLWAIDYPSFTLMSGGLDMVRGHPPEAAGDVVVDSLLADARALRIGDRISMLNRVFHVAGVSRPGSGGRIYARIQDIQDAIGTPGRASFFLVKGSDPRQAGALTRSLEERFPGYKVTAIAQVSRALQENAVGLSQFKKALTGIAVVLSFVVVLLAMYTAVIERTREIGILRAMGATRSWVVGLVLGESLLLSLVGAILGLGLAFAGRAFLLDLFPAEEIQLSAAWFLAAAALSIAGGLLGSLYPALLAARMEPVEALNFE